MFPVTLTQRSRLWVVRLVILFVFWPGPIPIGHCHDKATNTTVSCAELSRHLSSHHGGVDGADHWFPDWHIHWVMPSAGFAGINGEEVAMQADCTQSPLDMVQISCCEHPLALLQTDWLNDKRCLRKPSTERSFQLVGFLSSRLSLPELFGVMLC